jgi:SagB-type dehydrogenase family enzyme
MKNPFELFRGPPAAPLQSETTPDPRRAIRAYHSATCHDPYRFARGPSDLDWDTQPNPFRRYDGARRVALALTPKPIGPRYADVMDARAPIPAERVDAGTVARLFEDSLAISAWKEYGDARWALRVNPSSGNLHPTEGYLLCGAIDGLCDAPLLAHYAPREHALEARADVPVEAWRELAATLPSGAFFVGLCSIHWREAWKYGERAYRYCQHDVGHAIACFSVAARALGWRIVLCDDLGHDDLATLLGVRDARGRELETPDCLLAVIPGPDAELASALPTSAPAAFAQLELHGEPNELSPDHVEWNAIEFAAEAARKPRTHGAYVGEVPVSSPSSVRLDPDDRALLRPIVHARRSAVSFDGTTGIERDVFYRVLASTLRGAACDLPWSPRVHLGLFVHRVRGLEPGLYLLARDPTQTPLLQAAMETPFIWQRPPECPEDLPLHALVSRDVRGLATHVSCQQGIAGDGAFAVAMLCEFDPALERHGAWFYPRLYWECGVVGQILYLEAEAIGVRATGIGCFFDEPTHAVFGLGTWRYRSLYHFTLGGPVDDPRLTTRSAYPAPDGERTR